MGYTVLLIVMSVIAIIVCVIIPACLVLSLFKPMWFGIDIPVKRYQFLGRICLVWMLFMGMGGVIMSSVDNDINIESILLNTDYSPADYTINDDGDLLLHPKK